jgi:hypothetical protein
VKALGMGMVVLLSLKALKISAEGNFNAKSILNLFFPTL